MGLKYITNKTISKGGVHLVHYTVIVDTSNIKSSDLGKINVNCKHLIGYSGYAVGSFGDSIHREISINIIKHKTSIQYKYNTDGNNKTFLELIEDDYSKTLTHILLVLETFDLS